MYIDLNTFCCILFIYFEHLHFLDDSPDWLVCPSSLRYPFPSANGLFSPLNSYLLLHYE